MWNNTGWTTKPIKRRIPLLDPDQIVRNTYRVLMTRGRDGLVLRPPDPGFEETADVLRDADEL